MLRRVDEYHPVTTAMRTYIEKVAQGANLVDFDLLAGFLLALFARLLRFHILLRRRKRRGWISR